MYVEIRKYTSNAVDEVLRQAERGFVPLISSHAGFKAYYMIKESKDTFATISIFDTLAEARESNTLARDWVKENLSPLLPQPPEITEGEVSVHKEK